MQILRHHFDVPSRSTTYTIIPIGDIHIGAAACDEDRFKRLVKRIEKDANARWVGLGDYLDLVNVKDPRFNVATLASWIGVQELSDLARAQRDHFLDLIEPIASKCLGLAEGNHETAIHKFTERDVYSDIVNGIKERGKIPASTPLSLGYYGWIVLHFTRGVQNNVVKFNIHHGFVGGKLAGAKSLEMQRWLWSHHADVVIFGHSHNTSMQVEQTEDLNDAGELVLKKRYGVYAGSFLRTVNEGASTYSEVKGYLPMPTSGVEIIIRPGAFDGDKDRSEPIRVATGLV